MGSSAQKIRIPRIDNYLTIDLLIKNSEARIVSDSGFVGRNIAINNGVLRSFGY